MFHFIQFFVILSHLICLLFQLIGFINKNRSVKMLYLNNKKNLRLSMRLIVTGLLFFLNSHIIASARLLATNCELCMQTYKVKCGICYNTCSSNNDFINCTKIQPNTQIPLTSGNCLETCCPSFAPNTPFNEPNFNLCMERDSALPNTNKIGLTLGLILGLILFPLFLAGLAYQFGILWFKDDNKEERNRKFVHTTKQDLGTIISSNSITNRSNSKSWLSDGLIINGICPVCNDNNINTVIHCNHGFHYDCLSNKIRNQNICPVCKLPDSLNSGKIYCHACREQFRIYNTNKQLLNAKRSKNSKQFKCPNCE